MRWSQGPTCVSMIRSDIPHDAPSLLCSALDDALPDDHASRFSLILHAQLRARWAELLRMSTFFWVLYYRQITAFVPNDGCLNFVDENDEASSDRGESKQ